MLSYYVGRLAGRGEPRERWFGWGMPFAGIWLALLLIAGPTPARAQPARTLDSINDVYSGSLVVRRDSEPGYLTIPVVDTDVSMGVTGPVARVRVRQTFAHAGDGWVNATYVFPLPENAAVDRLRMRIGAQVIEGEIHPRKAARKRFEQARDAGKKATLVEQQRPNIFTSRVANLGPGEQVVVEIEYQHLIDFADGWFSLRFPMTVGPRFIPGMETVGRDERQPPVRAVRQRVEAAQERLRRAGLQVPPAYARFPDARPPSESVDRAQDARAISPPMTEVGEGDDNPVSISVSLLAGMSLAEVKSEYHSVVTTVEPGHRYHIELEEGQVPADRDFVLRFRPEPGQVPQAAFFEQWVDDERFGLLMLLPPEAEQARRRALPREVIFVVDTSGSMGGDSLAQAKRALTRGLDALGPDDAFNVVQFNSVAHEFSPSPVPASVDNLERARRYVADLIAEGGTEVARALHAVLNRPDSPVAEKVGQRTSGAEAGQIRQVVFITDGSVGNEAELFDIIHQHLGSTRLFMVGIGSAPNSYFMREAAHHGRGTFTHIGAVHEVERVMSALFDQLEFPVLVDLRIEGANDVVEHWPSPLPDLFVDQPLMVSMRLRGADALELRGRYGGADWSATVPVVAGDDASGLDVAWAREKIASLERSLARGADRDAVREAITALGLRHHLVTAHTSLVAVDVTPTRPSEANAKDASVPNKMPAGWTLGQGGARLPQTATPMMLHLLIGAALLALALVALRSGRRA